MRSHSRIVIAHHLILHGYAHWLPNDPRGSESQEVESAKLADLGPVHFGRKRVQPPREELRAFHDAAAPLLAHAPIWFDAAKRQALAESIAQTLGETGYTVWACAVMRNHVHLCVRRHRDDALTIWTRFAQSTSTGLRLFADVANDHPIWSDRPYKVFLYTPADVRRVIAYIENNPPKRASPRSATRSSPPITTGPHPPLTLISKTSARRPQKTSPRRACLFAAPAPS